MGKSGSTRRYYNRHTDSLKWFVVNDVTEMINEIYDSGEIPEGFSRSHTHTS